MPELPAAFEAACRRVAPDQRAALQAEAVHARLLHVLLHKDAPHLSAILSSGFASAEQLAVVKPLGVFHAAALSGWAEAVPQLVAAGAPIRSAEAFLERNAPAHALSLLGPPADRHQRFVTHHGASALAIAAARGDPETIRALLAVDVGTRHYTPLELLAPNVSDFPAERSEAAVRALVEAGADVSRLRLDECLEKCCKGCPAAGCLLLQQLSGLDACGQLGGSPSDLCCMLRGAVLADDAASLEYFAEELEGMGMWLNTDEVDLLMDAAAAGATSILEMWIQGEATEWHDRSAAARLLGSYWGPGVLPPFLEVSARHGHAATVAFLLREGAAVTAGSLCSAVRSGSMAVLDSLLAAGRPAPSQLGALEPCPFLTALVTLAQQEQKEERQAELEGADQVHWWNPARSCWPSRPAEDDGEELDTAPAVHPWDARLLPMVEALRAAGYRPAPLEGAAALVAAYAGDDSESDIEEVWDEHGPVPTPPLDIDAEGQVWWLWLAAREPVWSRATHRRYLPSFKAAAHTLLLAAKRGSRMALDAGDQSAGEAAALRRLGTLPRAALQQVLGLAAYPLSAWAQLDL